jgi:hypothetical protein
MTVARFTVADFPKSSLLPRRPGAGMGIVSEGEGWALLGTDGNPEFWLGGGSAPGAIHFAFVAKTRDQVRAAQHRQRLLALVEYGVAVVKLAANRP